MNTMQGHTILIVDDNKSVLTSLELLLEEEFERIETASNPNRILSIMESITVDLVILDMNFKSGVNTGNEGLFWLKKIQDISPGLPVIMLTAYGDVELAVQALKDGAADFVLKPWDNEKLIEKIRSALRAVKERQGKERIKEKVSSTSSEPAMIIGQSPVMIKLIRMITKVARTDATILISGENGTGKEMLAREVHRLSSRNAKEMVSVDMGAISESLFESELFGHEKGAFTDAKDSRPGKFEAANKSTLFLDEMGNLPLSLQAKLLAVLQNREVTPLGGNRRIPVDIRLIAATNRNLPAMISNSEFREDLFYRINTIQVEIPPLRNRREDIPLFIDYFLRKYTSLYKRTGLSIQPQAISKLEAYDWPGNIRELQHTIEKAVILAEKEVIKANDLFLQPGKSLSFKEAPNLNDMEKQAIEAAISQNEGNLTAAAEQLGISRQTLYNKLKKFHS